MLFSKHPSREIRGLVKSIALHQVGHFMMGTVIAGPYKIAVSGTYGADGLTKDPSEFPGLWEALIDNQMPTDVVDAFWKGGGHNDAGAEGPAVHAWAVECEADLRKLSRVDWLHHQRLAKWDKAIEEFKGAKYYALPTVQRFLKGERGECEHLGLLLLRTIMGVIDACTHEGEKNADPDRRAHQQGEQGQAARGDEGEP